VSRRVLHRTQVLHNIAEENCWSRGPHYQPPEYLRTVADLLLCFDPLLAPDRTSLPSFFERLLCVKHRLASARVEHFPEFHSESAHRWPVEVFGPERKAVAGLWPMSPTRGNQQLGGNESAGCMAAAIRRSFCSSNGAARNWLEIGRPDVVCPHGTAIPGIPARLALIV
jgi:hypothetical protein